MEPTEPGHGSRAVCLSSSHSWLPRFPASVPRGMNEAKLTLAFNAFVSRFCSFYLSNYSRKIRTVPSPYTDFLAPGLVSPSATLPGFLPFQDEFELYSFLLGTFPTLLATSGCISDSRPEAVPPQGARWKQMGMGCFRSHHLGEGLEARFQFW